MKIHRDIPRSKEARNVERSVMRKLRGLPAAHLLAVEHAQLIVALYAAAAALDDHGVHRAATAARAVLEGMAMRAVH